MSSSPTSSLDPRNFPRIYEEQFVSGCLYLMLRVPNPIYTGKRSHNYPLSPPEDFDFTSYEPAAARGDEAEEFDWELYWHLGPTNGKIYRLEKDKCCPSNSGYERFDVESIRDMHQCVGFIRVLSTEESARIDVENFIDWTTRSAAQGCHRSFSWATMSIYRIRRHFRPKEGLSNPSFYSFNMSRFVEEVLCFAYDHVRAAIRGKQRFSPIMPSWFSLEVTSLMLLDSLLVPKKCEGLTRRSRWFKSHQESQWYVPAIKYQYMIQKKLAEEAATRDSDDASLEVHEGC
ncbi:hypothetical protein F5X68DRAFT_243895 [Plectosphaerella plurivora]|uniref:Uncharacterized protein n=1 Tax=Plectosphaerella plurivora TaxID=936078 RepID=A0A9P8VMJ5_9PEZI|nr:hypothetical protein F5X68DRAFT_243895 [Plectosphaerella plurivora]